jgi:hypothetical protein
MWGSRGTLAGVYGPPVSQEMGGVVLGCACGVREGRGLPLPSPALL